MSKHDNRPVSNRIETSVDNRNIDSVMNIPVVYRQLIAESFHDIDKKSNELNSFGYQVVLVTPILSGRFVILGKK